MVNFIKMDIRRLFRSKSFYVILAIFMFITSVNIYSAYRALRDRDQNADNQYVDENGNENGDDLYSVIDRQDNVTYENTLRDLYDGHNNSISLLIALIMTIFICTEYQTGYIKNISTITSFRWYNIISKMAVGIMVLLCFNLLGAGSYFIANRTILDHAIVGNLTEAFKIIGIQFLIQMAIVAMYIFICTVGRSKAFCITVGILISGRILSLPMILLASKISGISGDKISSFLLTYLTELCNGSASSGVLEKAIVLSVAWFIVFMVSSCIIFKRRDI